MASPPLTVQLPDDVYLRLQSRAGESRRSVQEELIHVVSLVIPGEQKLPGDLEAQIADLATRTDEQLWELARQQVPAEVEARLEALADLRRQRELADAERAEQLRLLTECDRIRLTRAKAAVLLKRRGKEIASLGPES